MMLGDLLAAARASSAGFRTWLESSDPELAVEVAAATKRYGMTETGFVRAAVSDFARFASEEDWATLTSSIRDSADPGTICLLAMVHWRLTVKGCDHHSYALAQPHTGASHERPATRPAD